MPNAINLRNIVALFANLGYNRHMLTQILLLTVASGVLSLLGAFILSLKKNWQHAFALQLTAFSSGVLLATSLLHLAPEALHAATPEAVFRTMLLAVLSFFVLERLVLWYHHHHTSHGPRPAAYLVVIGDSLHNFIDGVLIASAVMVQPELGILTALAVAAHELPQEIADFSVMVASGVSRKKALLFNLASALTAVVGAVLVYMLRDSFEAFLPLAVAFSAGMFLYISLSDLIPELHHHTKETAQKWIQLGLLVVGIMTVVAFSTFLPDVHLHGESDGHGHEAGVEHDDAEHLDEDEHADEDEDNHLDETP